MKTSKITVLLFLLLTTFFYAQGPKKEKLKALKVAFITKELSLSAAEAEKFWPVFNAFESKQFEIRFKKMSSIKSKINEGVAQLSEKEAQILLTQIESTEEELHQNRKKLVNSLKTILPAIKILKLKKAEDDFNKKLLKQYRNKHKE